MRHFKLGLALAGITTVLLVGCGGGGGGSGSSSGGNPNTTPTANAGPAQTVNSGDAVTLNGSASNDPDGSIASYAWTQTAGGAVTLSSASVVQPTFTAPTVTTATTLTFSLTVTDNRGATSAASTVNVTVNPIANTPPTANAGPLQSVPAGQVVNLNGTGSVDPDGTISTYAWAQTAGPAVTLSNAASAVATFTAPAVASSTDYAFSLTVTDDDGASSTATVDVTVNPVGTPNVTITGRIRHARAPFNSTGLNYAGAVFEPTRGVVVQATYARTENVISRASTDANGDYSLQVPGNTSVQIRAIAWLLRDTTQLLPRYDIRVQDGLAVGVTSPYSYVDARFDSGSGATRNVDIPLNIDASGRSTGIRASGPFAILDTVYRGMELIVDVAPLTNFPPLIIDWGSQAGGTFFSGASPQRIALLSDLTEDTDEFDAHVIAHEFGHYIEHNFSRADNIGGPHSLGQRLDPRVAFGEGFGYAFAAMVMGDPVIRDSFVNTNGQLDAGVFSVESNPTGTNGCWCSESSVFSILYDLFDSTADGSDTTLALGFQPIWNILVGEQRSTPAFTTIFTFITSLKAAQPAIAADINSLVAAQNINAVGINAFATAETNFPPNVPQNAALPIYTDVTIGGGPYVLRSVDDAGVDNKLSSRRFLRFEATSTRNITVTLSTSNTSSQRDPDFLVWKAGAFVRDGTDPPTEYPETETFQVTPGTYLIEVYDCANGCNPTEPANGTGSGDYDLTVTIN